VLGVRGGLWDGNWQDLLEVNSVFRADPDNPVPLGMLWFHDWGLAVWSLVDCRTPQGWMWGWDPSGGPDQALFPENLTITDWFVRWLDGHLEMPRATKDS